MENSLLVKEITLVKAEKIYHKVLPPVEVPIGYDEKERG
jgi:hypothetical protein